ncbi:Ger(x)C family spore germination protein [Paenibacillus lignilyticus]|uniref:Ger(X)C family spore germination protein n=1 Tax=Paenibacillus lignilyticus TaxID=1172615 RepID=A0ABS5CL05_9BACL|nr:Ger(x)C family spore germination protein [Paenibacillus lignilyticus]MBP3966506.1 Ger(x)C family spore germination protein [Paenibacillus lignilyticus]
MKRRSNRTLLAFCCLLLLTGCWDRTEINEYAFWMGTALDKGKVKKVRVSAQIAVPHEIGADKGSASSRSTLVITSEGNTLLDSCQNVQNRLPRRLFIGHRRAVFISERLAREGISDFLDMYSRNPELSLRSGLFIVIGIDPEEILKMESPFNPFSSDVIVRQDKFSKIGDMAAHDLFVDYSSEGTCPILSAISTKDLTKAEKGKVVDINQLAVFNKQMQMVGLLDEKASMITLWMSNRLKLYYLTEFIPEGKGYVTVDETNLNSKITTEIKNGKPVVNVTLSGVGTVRENETNLDVALSKDLTIVENDMNRYVKKLAEDTIKQVQREYGTDIFGFGEKIHQEHAKVWRTLRRDWEQQFRDIEVHVDARIHLKRIGVFGPRPKQGNLF